jgi:GNAT superfamily N-acetyltransferase
VRFEWRGPVDDTEIEALHAEGFGHEPVDGDWRARLDRHSLGWVCARDERGLVGFVTVAWDGGAHAFVLDTLTAARVRRQGIGVRLVAMAAEGARSAGCEWLHVDFDEGLEPFYLEACGFTPTPAGRIGL